MIAHQHPPEKDDFLPSYSGPHYALIPAYAIFYVLNPLAASALLAALTFWEVLHRIKTTH